MKLNLSPFLRNAVSNSKPFEDYLQEINPELKAITRNVHNLELARSSQTEA